MSRVLWLSPFLACQRILTSKTTMCFLLFLKRRSFWLRRNDLGHILNSEKKRPVSLDDSESASAVQLRCWFQVLQSVLEQIHPLLWPLSAPFLLIFTVSVTFLHSVSTSAQIVSFNLNSSHLFVPVLCLCSHWEFLNINVWTGSNTYKIFFWVC